MPSTCFMKADTGSLSPLLGVDRILDVVDEVNQILAIAGGNLRSTIVAAQRHSRKREPQPSRMPQHRHRWRHGSCATIFSPLLAVGLGGSVLHVLDSVIQRE